MNTANLLYEVVNRFPKKTSLIEGGQETTYEDLWLKIEYLSCAFYRIGIREDRRIVLVLPNSSAFICSFFALLKLNAIVTPLSPDITPYELNRIFCNLKPHAIISSQQLINKTAEEYPASMADDVTCIFAGPVAATSRSGKFYELQALFSNDKKFDVATADNYQAHPATINYTYRGLGYPLGAVLTHENYQAAIQSYAETTGMSAQHKVLAFLPFCHIYPLVGCLLAPLISGATVVISKQYTPKSILKIIDDLEINYFTSVPAIYNLLLQYYKKEEYDISSLTCCITGGAYMSSEIIELLKVKMGLEVLQGYGLTETFILTWNRFGYNKIGTLGLPFASDISIKIVDENGGESGAGRAGEVVVKSPSIMSGYYNHSDETKRILKEGWLYTGDYGSIDEEGYLYFEGIKKKIVKVGGNMVDFEEVRNVLLSCPFVSEASVFAVEDALWGHVVGADVIVDSKGVLSAGALAAFCRRKLSGYKVPKMFKLQTTVD